jgi:hypothetical protein
MSTTKLSLSSFGKRKGRTRGGTPWLADERLQPPFARRVGRVMPSFFMRKRSVFYGNLYHLNAEEEPELPDYPKDPAFRAKYGPRGVMDCKPRARTTRPWTRASAKSASRCARTPAR